MMKSLKENQKFRHFRETLKFSLYCSTHPLDGYWDLTHEKRGSISAATFILVLLLIARVARLGLNSFIVITVQWEKVNIFVQIFSVVFILALWVVGNWALTTLFDGKGKLGQVYMATCYALIPYPIIQFIMIIMSQVITGDEAAFWSMLDVLSVIWPALLIICAMMEIHEYTISKTLLFAVATIFAMLIMVFILLLFFSMISQGVSYFISIYKEMMFRI